METNWYITDLKRKSSNGLVLEINYECQVNLSGSTAYKSDILAITGSTSDPNFISFDNLTQDTVLGWLSGSIDQSAIESNLVSNINSITDGTHSLGVNW